MRILIPDLAQQDHSSSKIAVSYGLILEEYYMQRRKIQIWLGILAICTSLGTPISTYADTQDVTTNVGDKTTIKSDGSDKETTNGQEDSSDTTSGGDTTVHYTEAQLKAMDAKKKLNYELRSILTEVRKNADENGMFHSPNSSIKDIGYSYGTVDVKKDQIDQILDYLKDFESILNKDNNRQDFDVISSVTNPIFDNMHIQLTTHADINDENQTVYLPDIHTSAVDAETGIKNSYRDGHITITDTVTYENLIPGNTYVLKGSLQEKVEEDGKITYKAVEAKMITSENDEETVADEATPVTGQTTFVPEAANGTVDVIFTFDGTELEDVEHTYVAFEDLYYQKGDDEIIVREHKDINDAEQTVYVPHIQTEVQDTESKSHNALADEKVTLEDTVSYEGLIPGKEYTMTGTLMDKETGKALLVNDKEVTAETKFVPEKADGTVVVTFTFDATGLEGKTLVAFETCTYEGKNVAVHTDINDEKQTIYVPELHTTATDKADGDKQLTSKGTLTVVDKIAYKNLIPGQKYTVTGVLMDKATKSALVIGGKEVTATKTFVPNKADGTVEIEFTFKGDGLESKTLVAFETISTNDSPVGEHKDINDTDQTVTLTPPPIPAVQTGDTNTMPILAVVTAVLAIQSEEILDKTGKDLTDELTTANLKTIYDIFIKQGTSYDAAHGTTTGHDYSGNEKDANTNNSKDVHGNNR